MRPSIFTAFDGVEQAKYREVLAIQGSYFLGLRRNFNDSLYGLYSAALGDVGVHLAIPGGRQAQWKCDDHHQYQSALQQNLVINCKLLIN